MQMDGIAKTDAPDDQGIQTGGAGAVAHGGAVGTAPALPCLNTINCNGEKDKKANQFSSGHKKTAFALRFNVLCLIQIYGLERIGFLTLTFDRHIVSFKQAQKALHSLMTGVLKHRYPEYIIVMERMTSKRIHYHLLVVVAEDIRTGFDFVAVKRGDYRSASPYLRREWQFWRQTAPKYGFGRTELLPIRKTAEGIAKYIGKYISKHIGQRLPEDKGAKLVRYSKGTNRARTSFQWNSPGANLWRAKLGAFCRMLGLSSDNYQERLKEWFGRNWVYVLRPLIEPIKIAELYPEEEVRVSLRSAWIIALNERERRRPKQRRRRHAFPKRPVGMSWLEHTLKED